MSAQTNERDRKAMARLKELTPYMSDKERERLVEEGRSETYKTYQLAWDACEQSERVRGLVEALKQVQARISGMAMTCFPINVRELDGSISQVRPKSPAGEAYDIIRDALAAWGDGK